MPPMDTKTVMKKLRIVKKGTFESSRYFAFSTMASSVGELVPEPFVSGIAAALFFAKKSSMGMLAH